jgi:ankyrin repeat protein
MSSEGSIDMGRAYPLHDAAEVGDVEAIRALLDRHTRAMTGSSRGINGLAELGGGDKSDDEDDDDDDDEFDPFAVGLDLDGRDADGCTALHISLLHRQLEVLKVLIEAGATVSKRLEGSTPAHIAITMGGVGHVGSSTVPEGGGERFACDALDLLLHSDANHEQQPLWKDDRGQTLLHVAGHFGLSQCLKHLLVLPGAEEHLNAKERMGLRPIHLAAGGGHVEAVKVLLSSGADASTSSFAGLKPLHLAVARGHWDVARLLLDAGASADVTNKQGLTPAVIATKRGLSIPSFLPELGGQANPEEENAQHILPTRIYAHDLCMKHHSCPVITRSGPEPPPENVRRLKVILDPDSGVLTSPEFSSLSWERVAPRAQVLFYFLMRKTLPKCSLHLALSVCRCASRA